jgi:predicted MFS family arabinose efflux permease
VLDALQFDAPDKSAFAKLDEKAQKRVLTFSDRCQLTLALGRECFDDLPDPMQARIRGNLSNNAERWRRTQDTYREVAAGFDAAGLDYAVLKGFSHCPLFVPDPRHRPQGDIDFLLTPEQVDGAWDAALRLGYQPIAERDRHPTDHLPTMVRKTGWQWRGDLYDPEMPLSIELHFRFWNLKTERLAPEGLDCFWERRQGRELEGLRFTGLDPADMIAYSTLHILRHQLRGDPRLFHTYELAWLLHHHADDAELWSAWHESHDPSLRRLEAVCFALAQRWYACRLPDAAREEIERLPAEVNRWLELHAWSPVASMFHANKDELWLHWALLESRRDRIAVIRRRVVPERLPGPADAVHVPENQLTWRIRARGRVRYLQYVFARLWHHTRALPSLAWSAVRWFVPSLDLGPEYWRLLGSEAFFDFGMFVFFLLYNLYLLQLGFRENFLGLMSGLMTAASVAGSVLSVFAIRRFGMRATIIAAFGFTAGLCALRATITSGPVLLGLAALTGLTMSVWPIALAPAVAAVTNEKNRPRGFSLICASGISIGIFGSLAAGRLPGWIARLHWASSSIASYRAALLVGCAIVLLSLWPLSRVNMSKAAVATRGKLHRPSPIVLRFLIAMAVWNLATGTFNPFSNVFFARMHMPVENISYTFSAAQLAQVVAILSTPFVFRKFGTARSIYGMELATGVALLALAMAAGPMWGAVAYTGYMMFQYMSEPGMFTYLMESVAPGERNSASALNFLVTFAGQAIAAAVSGAMLARFGYPPVLAVGAAMCVAAALLFRVLLVKPGARSVG